jgi:hypothetical protein
VGVRVGEQAAVHQERSRDHWPRGVAGRRPLQLTAQQLEERQRGVVEGDHDGGSHAVVPPQRLDQIRSLDGGVRVVAGLIRVTLPDRLHVQPRAEAVAEHPVHLGPAVGAVRESGQQREPCAVRVVPRTRHALEDPERTRGRGGLLLGQRARRAGIVRDPLTAAEPLRRRYPGPIPPWRTSRLVPVHREPPWPLVDAVHNT